jgi:hypothetical protein
MHLHSVRPPTAWIPKMFDKLQKPPERIITLSHLRKHSIGTRHVVSALIKRKTRPPPEHTTSTSEETVYVYVTWGMHIPTFRVTYLWWYLQVCPHNTSWIKVVLLHTNFCNSRVRARSSRPLSPSNTVLTVGTHWSKVSNMSSSLNNFSGALWLRAIPSPNCKNWTIPVLATLTKHSVHKSWSRWPNTCLASCLSLAYNTFTATSMCWHHSPIMIWRWSQSILSIASGLKFFK